MSEKFLNLSGLNTLWTKLKSTFAKVVHTHAASDITSGTFGTSRIANAAITTEKVKDGAITPSKLNIISLPYQREANGGKNWHRVFKIVLPTDRTTAESRHSKAYRVFDLYIDGYNNQGKYSYIGKLGLNFSIATGMTIADYNFLTHGYARAKWIFGRPYDSNYDCKIVKTESSIEFFILSNSWDTNLSLICEKQYYGNFGDGVFDFTIVTNAYTTQEFETYCCNKVVVDSELDDMKIGSATSADSATKATQDGSGNNIVNTYATKKELISEAATRISADQSLQAAIDTKASVDLVTSLGQKVQNLTAGVNGKLNIDGSNANESTLGNITSKVESIGDHTLLTDNDEIISSNKKFSLGALLAWLIDKFKSLTVAFGGLKVNDGGVSVDVASKRYVTTYYEKLLEVGQGLEINDKSDGSCRIIRMESVGNPTSVLFYHPTEGFKLPTQFTFNTLGQFKSSLGSNTLPLPTSFGTSGKILTSNGDGTLPSWEDPPSSLKRVNSYTDEITSTKTGQTFLQLFKEFRSNNTTRLNADVDVCLYGSGYSYDFKLLISIARGGSGTISKCRITIIPLTTNTITIKVRKDSYGLLGIVWENAPSYSDLNVKVSLNTCISSYWITPSLIFAESGSTFGSELTSSDYSSYSSSIKTVAFK